MCDYKYHVALSFAGEDRKIAEELWQAMTNKGLRVFYDKEHQPELWGADLTKDLPDVYSQDSQYCLMLISENYFKKKWTNFERQFVVARNLFEREYILPIRLDDTQMTGIPRTIGILDLREMTIAEIIDVLVAKLFNPESVKTFKDSEIGRWHLHIDSSDNFDFNLVEELSDRDFSVTKTRIQKWISGPQRSTKSDVYEVHTPENQNTEDFSQLITVERRKRNGEITDGDISDLLKLLSNYTGTVIEVEKKVGSINEKGEWSGRFIEDDSMTDPVGLFRTNSVGQDLLEIHHQIDIPRKNDDSDIDPLNLEDLRRLSVDTGLDIGGWFLFERKKRWSYRSNSFLPLQTEDHEFLRQYRLFNQSLCQYLEQQNLKASHRMIVEKIIGIWKVNPPAHDNDNKEIVLPRPKNPNSAHLERRKLAEWEQNITQLNNFWVVAPNFLGDRFPEFKKAMLHNLVVRRPPAKYFYFLSSQTDLHRLRKLVLELSTEYGEELGNNFDAIIFWDKTPAWLSIDRNYFIANPLDPKREGYTLNTAKGSVIRAQKLLSEELEKFVQSLLPLIERGSRCQDIYIKKVTGSPKIKEEGLSVMRTRLIEDPDKCGLDEWEKIVFDYDRVVAEVVSQNGGNVVKASVSLGYIATFQNAKSAIECAQELQRELQESFSHVIALEHGTVSRVWRAHGIDYIGKSIQSVEYLKDVGKNYSTTKQRSLVLMSERFRLQWIDIVPPRVVEERTRKFTNLNSEELLSAWELLPLKED